MSSTQERQFSGPPLVSSEKNGNGVASRKPKTREISSRYKSSTPFSSSSSSSLATTTVPSLSRRCPSPNITRSSSLLEPKRAQSVERKRPTNRSSSPSRPTTPVHESKLNNGIADVKRSIGKSPESLWPSTRSLCVSFQADSFTLPVTKRERHVNHNSDRALASSGNRHSDSPSLMRKMTPERKRTPLRGQDQSENSKPVDNSLARTIDQHRWPGSSLIKGSNGLNRSVDLSDRPTKAASLLIQGWASRSDAIGRGFQYSVNGGNFSADLKRVARRMSFDGTAQYDVGRSLNRENLRSDEDRASDYLSGDADPSSPGCCLPNSADSSSSAVDSVSIASEPNVEEHYSDSRSCGTEASSPARAGVMVSSRFWQEASNRILRGQMQKSLTTPQRGLSCVVVTCEASAHPKHVSSLNQPERAVSTPRSNRSQSLPSSPIRATVPSSPSRGMSPSRIRGGVLPSSSTPVSRTNSCSSILNFISEVKKGKKGLNQIEDAHQLRLLHNRYLQWRFANARADATCSIQNVTAEDLLYSVYITASDLRHSVILKRIKLQQLRRDINLHLILKGQVPYLDEWAFVENDHYSSLSGVVEALEASTVRLPVTNGARADIHAVKEAIISAVEVIQVMSSSISSLLSKVDRMNDLISELADVTSQASACTVECGDLLSRITTFQVEECSHRTHLMQLMRAIIDGKQTNLPVEAMV